MFELVCFDFWLTLFAPGEGRGRHESRVDAFEHALKQMGSAPSRDALSRVMGREWRHFEAVHRAEHRTLGNRERVVWMCRELGIPVPENETLDALLVAFEGSLFAAPPRLVEGMDDLLRDLSQTAHVALISDTAYSGGRTLWDLMGRCGVAKYFDVALFSDEIGHAKPHPEPFRRVLAQTGVPPGRAIHIGDREWTDVAGAKREGLSAILFTQFLSAPPESTEADYVADSVTALRQILVA